MSAGRKAADDGAASGISPLCLECFGSRQCEAGEEYGPHWYDTYVLYMVTAGCGRLKKGVKETDVREGEAFLIRPGETAVFGADQGTPWQYMWVGFRGFQAESMMRQAGFTQMNSVAVCRNMPALKEAFGAMCAASELTYVNRLYQTSALLRVIALITENAGAPVRQGEHQRPADERYVERAMEILSDHYPENIRVADVAGQIGISRNYLASIFRKNTGMSPQAYLMSIRMESAASLLRGTVYPVGVIAGEVGYSDAMNFSKAFRRYFSMSPSEYREAELP